MRDGTRRPGPDGFCRLPVCGRPAGEEGPQTLSGEDHRGPQELSWGRERPGELAAEGRSRGTVEGREASRLRKRFLMEGSIWMVVASRGSRGPLIPSRTGHAALLTLTRPPEAHVHSPPTHRSLFLTCSRSIEDLQGPACCGVASWVDAGPRGTHGATGATEEGRLSPGKCDSIRR